MIAIAVAGLLVACVLLAGGGYISARQLGFIGKKTAVASIAQGTPASPAPLATTALVPGDLPTATQPVHTLPPSPSPSLFPTQALPTLVTPPPALPTVQTPAIVNLASPTVELLPTATFTSAPVQANDLFNDTFAGDAWKGHWLVWGNPRPLKRTGGGGSWLSLTAFEDPGSAGMTTRPEFPIPDAPGVEVEFEATLDNNYPGGIFLVDWDPRSNQRGPDNSRPGVFRLEIQSDRFLLSAAGVLPKCEFDFDFDALQKHIYLIRIQPGQVVEVYLDQAPQVACQVQLDVIGPQPGSISFSGIADLTRARVSVPLQP